MVSLIVILIAFALQLLSIWAAVSKEKEKSKKKWIVNRLSCTMVAPSLIGVATTIILMAVANEYSWVGLIVFVALNILGLFIGASIHEAFSKNNNKKTKHTTSNTITTPAQPKSKTQQKKLEHARRMKEKKKKKK